MSKHTKHSQEQSAVVVMSADKPTLRRRLRFVRSPKFIIAFCLLLAAGSVAAALVAMNLRANDKPLVTADQTADGKGEGSAAVQAVNDRIANGEPGEAAQVLKDNPDLANSRDGMLAAASIDYANGKYEDGIKQYMAIAEKYGWTSNLADRVARGYALLKDKDKATEYYNKAILLIDKENNPTKEDQKKQWRQDIEALQ